MLPWVVNSRSQLIQTAPSVLRSSLSPTESHCYGRIPQRLCFHTITQTIGGSGSRYPRHTNQLLALRNEGFTLPASALSDSFEARCVRPGRFAGRILSECPHSYVFPRFQHSILPTVHRVNAPRLRSFTSSTSFAACALFHSPYLASPLFATLTKTGGVYANSSQKGTT